MSLNTEKEAQEKEDPRDRGVDVLRRGEAGELERAIPDKAMQYIIGAKI
jgi:hypothetical protein